MVCDSTPGSFFGPFYGGYHIIALDKSSYNYAMFSGPTLSYLWILSRTTEIDETVYSKLVARAGELGFDTSALIRIVDDRSAKSQYPEAATKMHSNADKRITPCPNSPNCVSSLAAAKKRFIDPIPFKGDKTVARDELLKILKLFENVSVVWRDDNYVHAEFKSSVFQFVDDVEFYFDDLQGVIQIKSASGTGYYDFGVNRRRLEKIRDLYEANTLKRNAEAP